MKYRRCGNSGLLLPEISLGLWHNFGDVDDFNKAKNIIQTAFDKGITHFDLANNYGPPPGSAETDFGKILKNEMYSHRDEMVISTKAGYYMWEGPYGEGGSKKHIIASLDQSLKRLQLEYVDIFYHHRPDPDTPLEETMATLDLIVRQGKALYVGLSNYDSNQTIEAVKILNKLGTPCLIHQTKYSMLNRTPEGNLFDTLNNLGIGCISFSPLAQGLLSDKYLNGIPEGSRAMKPHGFLKKEVITEKLVRKIKLLNEVAKQNSMTLAQMAIAWNLRISGMTSVLIGASEKEQILENVAAPDKFPLNNETLTKIEKILS